MYKRLDQHDLMIKQINISPTFSVRNQQTTK